MSRVFETVEDGRKGRPARRSKARRVNSRRATAGRIPDAERDYYYDRMARLIGDGLNDLEVAERVGVSCRTVHRYRHHPSRNIPNVYERTAA